MEVAAGQVNYEVWVNKLNELPTLPTIVYELSRIINNPMSSTKDIEKVMSNDQSLTMKVLKLANSAYYAIPGGVSSLSRAVAFLGFDTVNQLILSSSIIDAMKTDSTGFDMNKFWMHSMGVAVASETIAKFTNYRSPADLFVCGLVHDIGKVAMFKLDPELLNNISTLAKENNLTIHQVEKEKDYAQHPTLGYLLAKKWRLPAQIQMVIRYHHEADPSKRTGVSNELNSVIDFIFLANLIIQALEFGNSGHSKVMSPPQAVFDRLNVKKEDFKKLALSIKERLASAETFIKMLGGS